MSRSQEILRDIPPTTLWIIGLCTLLYVLQLILDLNLNTVTLCPHLVLYLHEYYRIITSCFFHADLMHVGMNMVSTAAISSILEKRFGTLRHLVTTLWSVLLTSCVYILVALFLSLGLGYDSLMYQHALGFSGVIFHMSILECSLAPNRSRSVFGFFSVPSYLYPVALLVALQMFMPNLSFTGHLAGIFMGVLQVFGFLDPISVSDDYLREMESWTSLRWLTSRASFCATPTPAVSQTGGQRDPTALWQMIQHSCGAVKTFLGNVSETLQVAVFGRGRDLNSNIQLAAWESSSRTDGAVMASDDIEDEEDWVGLPAQKPDTMSRIL
jgi:membrane associated rhomboid family serine protease